MHERDNVLCTISKRGSIKYHFYEDADYLHIQGGLALITHNAYIMKIEKAIFCCGRIRQMFVKIWPFIVPGWWKWNENIINMIHINNMHRSITGHIALSKFQPNINNNIRKWDSIIVIKSMEFVICNEMSESRWRWLVDLVLFSFYFGWMF